MQLDDLVVAVERDGHFIVEVVALEGDDACPISFLLGSIVHERRCRSYHVLLAPAQVRRLLNGTDVLRTSAEGQRTGVRREVVPLFGRRANHHPVRRKVRPIKLIAEGEIARRRDCRLGVGRQIGPVEFEWNTLAPRQDYRPSGDAFYRKQEGLAAGVVVVVLVLTDSQEGGPPLVVLR